MRQIAKSSQTKWMNKMKEMERERAREQNGKKINKSARTDPKANTEKMQMNRITKNKRKEMNRFV